MQSCSGPTKYHNLDITIDKQSSDQYTVRATSSECGEEGSTIINFPYSNLELMERANLVFRIIREAQQGIPDVEEEIIRQFGRELFESLISGRIHILYERCMERTGSAKNTGLRLRLHISDPELATVPWEYLYDPARRKFIASYHSSPVIRYIDLQQSTKAPIVKSPLNLLCMISTPNDLARLAVEREKQIMESALEPLIKSNKIEIEWIDSNTTYENLQRLMRTKVWHIFHFIGHGGFDAQKREGYLCFTGPLGEAHKNKCRTTNTASGTST